ncbi:hypothetical protein SAMN02910384_02561 [Pseudobutyrivibrio sp. ACV-2]|uniref:hypothetical protein n=1 Tax=Pseudobutyrivibrio sp. ACV-2 TaxID=1520801 RepID=UPI000897A733|nr:hypothetical protein [Pseudobutyrivibrio sp. ACV-2]SEA86026.1 hypothetical protein SAMN02910384_02561 [Pseudobutyrivibrio sp. ACV-2]
MPNEKEIMYDRFLELQQQVHLKNQKKIRVGLKVNIILPLIFLTISFLSNRSKLVFLVLWIVSLFGIAFYLLYVEYMDFKLQERMKEFGIIDSEENEALIGNEVVQGMRDINNAQKEMVKDIKERKDEIKKEIKTEVKKVGGKIKK